MSSFFSLPVVPVLDLRNGLVVRGVAGNRDAYQPLQSNLVAGSNPADIAAALIANFSADTLYIADLDAIEQDRPQWDVYQELAATGIRLWLDAGIGTACQLGRLDLFLSRQNIPVDIVIGLESLRSLADWEDLLPRLDLERMIFSIDLKQGRLLTEVPEFASLSPAELATMMIGYGVQRFILLDLAAVGMGTGVPTLSIARDIRRRHANAFLQLIGGGGVHSKDDLQAMADAGFDAALVASALHDGRLSPTAST